MDYAPHPTMDVDVASYQIFDIATLQYLYGVDSEHAAGDDVYAFSEFDGTVKTIWDGGGIDVLDMSAATYAVDIDLNEGSFSTVTATGQNNLGIAFGTVIEDAIGGAYDDWIAGNQTDNQLTGGGGSDIFAFAAHWGDDTITDFERGKDSLDFAEAGASIADLGVSSSGGVTQITFGEDSVLLLGVSSIDESDFLIA